MRKSRYNGPRTGSARLLGNEVVAEARALASYAAARQITLHILQKAPVHRRGISVIRSVMR